MGLLKLAPHYNAHFEGENITNKKAGCACRVAADAREENFGDCSHVVIVPSPNSRIVGKPEVITALP
jgi:hypothetical protein